VLPRLVHGLLAGRHAAPLGAAVWGDTRVRLPPPAGALHDVFTGTGHAAGNAQRELTVAAILDSFPVALLVSGPGAVC
jgi:maltooligosyltrehalose synthase